RSGRPPTSTDLGPSEAVGKSDAGARTSWVAHCCLEHAGQIFGSRPSPRAACPYWSIMGVKEGRSRMRAIAEEIPDAESEQVLARVCAIDVAKESGMVCTRLPGPTARRVSRVWQVAATTNAVGDLAAELVAAGVQKVTVESTSDYWRIWFYLLEAAGLDVQLVNARDVKNVPGRPKTDKLDVVWQGKLTGEGVLRRSVLPPPRDPGARHHTPPPARGNPGRG